MEALERVQDKAGAVGERYGAFRDLVLGFPSETSATWVCPQTVRFTVIRSTVLFVLRCKGFQISGSSQKYEGVQRKKM